MIIAGFILRDKLSLPSPELQNGANQLTPACRLRFLVITHQNPESPFFADYTLLRNKILMIAIRTTG